MTGFYFPETPDNRLLRQYGGPMLPSALGETLEATFDDPTLRPTELIANQREMFLAEDRPTIAERLAETRRRREEALGRSLTIREAERIARTGQEPELPEDFLPPEPEGEISGVDLTLMTAAEANEKYGDIGLKFDAPVNPRVAELMAEKKQEERIRQDIIARGPQGVFPTLARFGAGFAGAAIDPLNIASAFIPVVGEARFAGMVARAGLTQARLARGAIEGAVGNALVEPIVYGLSQEQQLDYEMADALANIAFGGILGGGLHVGVGRVGDMIAARSAETREAALRSAVAQAATGRQIDVDPLYRADFAFLDPDRALAPERGVDIPPAREFDLGQPMGQGRGQSYRDYTPIGPQDRVFLEGLVEELRQTDAGQRIFREADRQGGTPDVIGVSASTPEWFQAHNRAVTEERRHIRRLRDLNKGLPDDQKVPVPKTPEILTRQRVESVVGKMLDRKPLGTAEAEVARTLFTVARERRTENARQMLEFRAERQRDIDAIAEREAADIAREQGLPERDITADFPASVRASRAVAERQGDDMLAVQAETEFLQEQMQAMREGGLIGDREMAAIEAVDALAESAESYGRAARAAAFCLSRRP